jgi:adenosylmethionine-8-amino-7-oxononanoate aminotransferase
MQPLRCVVLTEEPSYHGMTAGALSASGHPVRRRDLQPLLANQSTVAKVRPRHGELRADVEAWEQAIDEAGAHNLAAVLIEPVGGASCGAAPAAPEVLRYLRERADRDGFLLIADEVMTGLGRTGCWFGCQHAQVVPDVMVVGKGISAGYVPLAAVLVSERIAGAFDRPLESLLFGHTMAGAPLATATGAAVLDYLITREVPARAARAGALLRDLLEDIAREHRIVTGVRGVGLQLALGLHPDPGRQPGTSVDLVSAARQAGLLLYPAGIDAATESVLIAPPLTSTDDDLRELARRLDHALAALAPAADRAAPHAVAAVG